MHSGNYHQYHPAEIAKAAAEGMIYPVYTFVRVLACSDL